jgi:hypothetical protein
MFPSFTAFDYALKTYQICSIDPGKDRVFVDSDNSAYTVSTKALGMTHPLLGLKEVATQRSAWVKEGNGNQSHFTKYRT